MSMREVLCSSYGPGDYLKLLSRRLKTNFHCWIQPNLYGFSETSDMAKLYLLSIKIQ